MTFLRMRWITAVLLIAAGCAAPPEPDQAAGTEPRNVGALHFTDVTQRAGLDDFRHETGAEGEMLFPESMGSGCAFIDFDGDGWIDVLVAGGGTWPGSKQEPVPALQLYRNVGDGTFTNATDEAGLGGIQAYSLGFSVADYDNDGDQDFYLTTVGKNMLFRNDDGMFVEAGAEAGVAGEDVWSSASIFFDADRDGWLDLYVGNYVEWSPATDIFCTLDGVTKDYCTPQSYIGLPARFYRNNGDGTFTERTQQVGLHTSIAKTLGVIELDYNLDGWPDLMVSNDTDRNLLFENDGDGTFTERGTVSGVAYDESGKTRAGMGIDAGVVDSTGEVSVFVGNFTQEMIGVWRHREAGSFTDRAAVSKIGRPSIGTLTFGLFLFDADLDGHLDLFAANGHVNPGIEKISETFTYAQPVHLFRNRGDGSFEDVAPSIGGVLQEALVARGAAYADYDRDGDLDILLSENGGGIRLWRNDLDSEAFLRVHVEGRESNRSGLGTRIVAYAGKHRMERRIAGGGSYLSASEHVATFGLGDFGQVDSLSVHWPSGRVENFGRVEGREVRIVEGSGTMKSIPAALVIGNGILRLG